MFGTNKDDKKILEFLEKIGVKKEFTDALEHPYFEELMQDFVDIDFLDKRQFLQAIDQAWEQNDIHTAFLELKKEHGDGSYFQTKLGLRSVMWAERCVRNQVILTEEALTTLHKLRILESLFDCNEIEWAVGSLAVDIYKKVDARDVSEDKAKAFCSNLIDAVEDKPRFLNDFIAITSDVNLKSDFQTRLMFHCLTERGIISSESAMPKPS